MLRKWKVFEGNTDEPQRLGRWYWDYECTCDKCGTELSLEDKVQTVTVKEIVLKTVSL